MLLRPYPLFEWCMTAILLLIPLTIIATPKTVEIGAFRFMVEIGFTPWATVIFYWAIGGLRAGALIANGRWRHGTRARAICAAAGAFFWFHMALALVLLTRETGTVSIGIPVYLVLAVGEIISAGRVAVEEALRSRNPSVRLVSNTSGERAAGHGRGR